MSLFQDFQTLFHQNLLGLFARTTEFLLELAQLHQVCFALKKVSLGLWLSSKFFYYSVRRFFLDSKSSKSLPLTDFASILAMASS